MSYEKKERDWSDYRQNELRGEGDFLFSEYWKLKGEHDNVLREWREYVKNLIPKNYGFNDVGKEEIVDDVWYRLVKYFNPQKNQNEWSYVNNANLLIQACNNYRDKNKISSLSLDAPAGIKTVDRKQKFNKDDEIDNDLVDHINIVGLMHVKGDRNPETDQEKLHFQILPKLNSRSLVVQENFGDFILRVDDEHAVIERCNKLIVEAILKFDIIVKGLPRVSPGQFEKPDDTVILSQKNSPIEFGMRKRIEILTFI